MTAANLPLQIAFLPFYVDYYEGICPEFPFEKAAEAEHCAGLLARHGNIVWDGKLIGDVDSAAALGQKLEAKDLDCAVVFPTIAVFGGIPWAVLKHLTVPILIWNAQQIEKVGASYTMVDIVRNTGQIGTQALANTLLREGRWFRVVTGYEKSSRTSAELERFFRIVRATSVMKRGRLLAIGDTFPLMTDILLDDDYLKQHLGASVTRITPQSLTDRFLSVSGSDVSEHTKAFELKHDLADITADEVFRSIRLCEAVESLVRENEADAGTLNCHGDNCLRNIEIGITACYSLGVQNERGRPFTCTGDLPTALAMLLLKTLTGVSMYTEVQVMDEKRGAIVIANSGEGEDAIRREGVKSRVIGNTNFTGSHGRGASFAYPLKPGPATLVSLTPTPKARQPFRLIVSEGEILEDTLPDAGALAGFFRFDTADLHVSYEAWLEAGAVHHAATAPGHWASELAEIAQLLNLEFVGV